MENENTIRTVRGVHLWLCLWRAARAVEQSAMQSIAALDMCLSDFAVLEALLHTGPQAVNALGKRVLLTSGSITVAVDRLEQRGLVHRTEHRTDRRTRIVALTAEGRALIRRGFATHERDLDRATQVLTAAEKRTLFRLLRKLEKAQ